MRRMALTIVVLPVPGRPKNTLCSDTSCCLLSGHISRFMLLYRVSDSNSSMRRLMSPTNLSSSLRAFLIGCRICTFTLCVSFCSISPSVTVGVSSSSSSTSLSTFSSGSSSKSSSSSSVVSSETSSSTFSNPSFTKSISSFSKSS